MIFGVNVEFIGLGFLFGASVWCVVYCVGALRRAAAISCDIPE